MESRVKHGGDWQSEVRLAYGSQLEREDYYASRTGEAPLINKVEWNFQPKDMSIYKFLKEYHNNIDADMLAVLRQTGDFVD